MIPIATRRRVFVDLSPLASDGSNGGAASFVLGLLRGLLSAPRPHAYHLLLRSQGLEAAASLVALGAVVHSIGRGLDVEEPRRLLRIRRRLEGTAGHVFQALPDRRSLGALGADVLMSPLGTATFHEPGLPHLVVAYDFQELVFPEFFSPQERRRRREFRAYLRLAESVVAISEFTRREAIQRMRVEPGRLMVLPPLAPPGRLALAEEEAQGVLSPLGLIPRGYAFYPANFWAHKNHARLLEAVTRTPVAELAGFRLVLCGALDHHREKVRQAVEQMELTGRVQLLPYQTEEATTALMQKARFVVYPSLYEGFGIPVFEAMQLGTPVAASSIGALEELTGGAATLFDPSDPAAISRALAELWTSEGHLESLTERGRRRAASFDLDGVVSAYDGLLAGAGPASPRQEASFTPA